MVGLVLSTGPQRIWRNVAPLHHHIEPTQYSNCDGANASLRLAHGLCVLLPLFPLDGPRPSIQGKKADQHSRRPVPVCLETFSTSFTFTGGGSTAVLRQVRGQNPAVIIRSPIAVCGLCRENRAVLYLENVCVPAEISVFASTLVCRLFIPPCLSTPVSAATSRHVRLGLARTGVVAGYGDPG